MQHAILEPCPGALLKFTHVPSIQGSATINGAGTVESAKTTHSQMERYVLRMPRSPISRYVLSAWMMYAVARTNVSWIATVLARSSTYSIKHVWVHGSARTMIHALCAGPKSAVSWYNCWIQTVQRGWKTHHVICAFQICEQACTSHVLCIQTVVCHWVTQRCFERLCSQRCLKWTRELKILVPSRQEALCVLSFHDLKNARTVRESWSKYFVEILLFRAQSLRECHLHKQHKNVSEPTCLW